MGNGFRLLALKGVYISPEDSELWADARPDADRRLDENWPLNQCKYFLVAVYIALLYACET